MFYFVKKDKPAKAAIVKRGENPCLLVDFYASSPQLIWQLDLKKNSTFSLSLKQDEQGEWDLGIETRKEPFKAVAHFDERGDAEDAYVVVQHAIDRGEVKFRHRLLRGILYVAAFFLLISVVSELFGGSDDAQNYTPDAQATNNIQMGVPMAADDVLPVAPN